MIQSEYNELGNQRINQRIFINWTKYHSFISKFAVLNSDSDNDSIRVQIIVQRIRKSTNFSQLNSSTIRLFLNSLYSILNQTIIQSEYNE